MPWREELMNSRLAFQERGRPCPVGGYWASPGPRAGRNSQLAAVESRAGEDQDVK